MRFLDLQEGPNDPGIFKAVFLAGGPGSGKSYVAQQLGLQARGLKVVNSDDAFEYLMRKRNLSFDMPPEQQPERDVARQRAKDITKKKQDMYLDGRLGLIIDGTAKDPGKMAKLKAELEAIGYQTLMVFVNTSLRTALQRNLLRDRKVPSDIVVQSHKLVQANKEKLSDVFATNYVEVNNDDNANFNEPLKRVDKFIDAPVTAQAKDWISKAQLQKTVTQEDIVSKPKVYVDMDGVIANFYAGVTRVTGHAEPRELALQDMEDTMASFKGTDFFYRLPKYDQADELIALVNKMTGGDWYILSSPLKYDREGSAKHKSAWVKKYLKIQPRGMHFTGDKAQFATQADGTPNILIDDYPKYLNSWKDAGGIGIKYKGHVGNIDDVKATLDQYLAPAKEQSMAEDVTSAELDNVEKFADKLFKKVGIDVNFTKHFMDRVNDERNGKPISAAELIRLFKKEYARWGKDVARLGPDMEGTFKDLLTDINLPFVLNWDSRNQELDLVAKTVMRKKDFKTSNQEFPVGEDSELDEIIRKVKGGYRLVSKKGKNLGTYPSKSGAEKRERQVQYFKHMGEQGSSTAVEPHEPGYQHSLLTAPQNTLVIDKSDDMDFYKLGQHYTSLGHYDKHELGVGPSDMTITFASPEEMERMKKVLDKLGVKYKDISGSHEEPEIHSKESRVNEVADKPYDYIQNVKTADKRAYRFQTDSGQLYRVQVFNRRKDDANKLEIHFDLTDMKTGKPETGVTGTGDAVRVFSTVASILQKEVAAQDPTGVIIASKADDESRVKLYRTLARRATKLMPDYEVAGERAVTGADGNPYLTIELEKK